jgi:copper homeostasis protein
VADIERAAAAGADRVELCGALELGGLTPSIGLVETAVAASPIPVVAMLRPRAGGFLYDHHEFAAMRRDAEQFLELGAAGIVFGVLDERGNIDAARCGTLLRDAAAAQTVFHRAFDFIGNQRAALDTLMDLGFTRVLTSGGKPTAAEGAATIVELVSHAAGRIEIMPGGGIRADNVLQIVRSTGCHQVHIGASTSQNDGSITDTTGIELVDGRFMQGTAHRAVLSGSVAETVSALRGTSLPR